MESVTEIARNLEHLVEEIKVRVAGSEAERSAAEFMAGRFREYGAARITIEEFPIVRRRVEKERLRLFAAGRWREYPCLLLGGAPGTGGREMVAPTTFFYAAIDYQRENLDFLAGRAVIHYGIGITTEEYRRLIAAKPAFILFVDHRYPGATPTSDGLIPAWVRRYGAVPSVTVAFDQVWEWDALGVERAALTVCGGGEPGTSCNVIADFPGADSGVVVYTGSHLDTAAECPGADDNASGMVLQLELARLLGKRRLNCSLRHIAFGCEEQLSVGSAAYARRHREEIASCGVFMLNFDSCGSRLGWNEHTYVADPALRGEFESRLLRRGITATGSFRPLPFIDLLPFNACGVPGMWIRRTNCAAGKFYHHRPGDTIDKISCAVIAAEARAAADFVEEVLSREPRRFSLPGELAGEATSIWNKWFGGFEGGEPEITTQA